MRIFWPVNRRDGEGMAPRSSNGITINEPDQLHTRASYRFRWASLDASVDGKGKRKMDDMSGATSTGCYITGASASTSFTRNEGIAAVHGSLEPDTRPINEPPMVQLRDIHAQTTASNAGMSDAVVYEAASDVLAGASSSFRSHIPATTYDTPIGAGTRNLRMNINSAASASTSQYCYCCSTRNGGTGLFSSRWSRPGRQPTATRGRQNVVRPVRAAGGLFFFYFNHVDTTQVSTPVQDTANTEYIDSMHEPATKPEETRATARRQLIMDDIEDQTGTCTKKAKQQE